MKVSYNWLKQLVDHKLSPQELGHALTMAGLEVEEMSTVAPPFDKIVVAEVRTRDKHPNADKLSVCSVDAGTGKLLQIVCGAPNVVAGMKVPCALVGAQLPPTDGKPFEIKAAKLRGVDSEGMLCSARELGLSEDHAGLLELPTDAPIGKDIRAYLDLDDTYYLLKLTPNRGDCLGMLGIARDVAAITGAKLNAPAIDAVAPTLADKLAVKVLAPDLCGRFSGRVVRNVNAKAPTPDWMKARLERTGQRSISALVDISNYVMLELGRPSHIFDLDKVHGSLTIRWGKKGEPAELLNGQTVEADTDVGVIADDLRVEALAGVMGGEPTAVSDDTKNIYIEAAFWWPEAIAGRARRYNFSTDAAHRFERGTDFATTALHVERITQLVLDVCGGEPGPVDDQIVRLPERKPVSVTQEQLDRLIGKHVEEAECVAIFRRLNCMVERVGEGYRVTPPSYRFDLNIAEDLVEEVARIHGFENVPPAITKASTVMRPYPDGYRGRMGVKHALVALGYQEVINYAFVDESWEADFAGNAAPVKLANPIASQMSVMRSSLIGGLVETLRANLNRGETRLKLFEMGRCFLSDTPSLEAQPERLAGLAYGLRHPEQWGEAKEGVDFFSVKGDLEQIFSGDNLSFTLISHPALHPGRAAAVRLKGEMVGVLGELHPKWQQKYELPTAPVVFEVVAQPLLAGAAARFAGVSKMPLVRRDIAVVVDEQIVLGDMLAAVRGRVPEQVRAFDLFDVYRGNQLGAKKKSLAFRVLIQDNSRTLTDVEVDQIKANIVSILEQEFAATLRA